MRPIETIYDLVCAGCRELYEATSRNSSYCHPKCRDRARKRTSKHYVFERRATNPIALTREAILFREWLISTAPEHAMGYRLRWADLQMWLPLAGKTKRYRGTYSSRPYFSLHDPFEAPRVPTSARYRLLFILPGGLEHPYESQQHLDGCVPITFPQSAMMKLRPIVDALKAAKRNEARQSTPPPEPDLSSLKEPPDPDEE